MACTEYRWKDADKPRVEEALRTSRTRREASAKLGVTEASLSHVCARFQLKPGALLQVDRMALPAPVAEAEDPGAAPWQGYRPKKSSKAPEPPPKAKSEKAAVTRTIVIADVHAPHQDPKAWGCALGIIKDVKPDRVVINGDFLDLESLSMHPKSRPDLVKLAEEYYAGNLALDSLQHAAGSADVTYLEGNHEARAGRWEAAFGQLDGLLRVPVGLYIAPREEYRQSTSDLRGIRWVPLHMQPFAIGAVSFLHGVFENIHHAHHHALHLGPRCSTRHLVTAHAHALQVSSSPSGHVAWSCPWLGDGSAQVFRYTKGRPRPWSHGLLLVEEAGETVTVSPVGILNGRAVIGGRVVQA